MKLKSSLVLLWKVKPLLYESAKLSIFSVKLDMNFGGIGMSFVASTYNFGYFLSMYTSEVIAVRLFGTSKFDFFLLAVVVALCAHCQSQ